MYSISLKLAGRFEVRDNDPLGDCSEAFATRFDGGGVSDSYSASSDPTASCDTGLSEADSTADPEVLSV